MRWRLGIGVALGLALFTIDGISPALAGPPEATTAAERGRIALTGKSHLSPGWSWDAYKKAGQLWSFPAPDPDDDPEGYAAAFNRRYGLHPAPYPNDGLPMGLRKATSRDGSKTGIQLDCMLCHGGSIGGKSYVGLGNSQLDLQSLLSDLNRADGQPVGPSLFTLNSSRGTNNAGQVAVFLLSFRNTDLSRRVIPLPLKTSMPELDTPAWWLLGRKSTKYYDGRTDARSARSNMQFMLGELSLEQFQELEPTFRDIDAYLKSIEAPSYPFPIDRPKAERGRLVFNKTCARCHGTYGPDGNYPNKIVPLEIIGTDPVRSEQMTDTFVAHYNSTWFAENYPTAPENTGYQAPPLDGVWATAPYLHNGSVPTVYNLLKSSTRPERFRRPPSTDFEHYDREHLGWTFEPVVEPRDPRLPVFESRFIVDTADRGLGNEGHTFGDRLSEEDRMAVIEYLKTL